MCVVFSFFLQPLRIAVDCAGDALAAVLTPIYRRILSNFPFSTLSALQRTANVPLQQALYQSIGDGSGPDARFGLDCVGLTYVFLRALESEKISGVALIGASKETHPALSISWQHGTRGDCGMFLLDVGAHFPLPLLLRRW